MRDEDFECQCDACFECEVRELYARWNFKGKPEWVYPDNTPSPEGDELLKGMVNLLAR